MFEKHIYCADFFRFFKEIIKTIPYPNDYVPIVPFDQSVNFYNTSNLHYLGIYSNY